MQDTGKNICVVGAGPAGLTAAYYLRKQGHNVTVKEALPKAGGMLQYGLPSYRMPREELDQEIAYILESGIKLETGVRVQNVTELKAQYDAVLVAIGNHEGTLLPMEGNDAEGILLNIDFLRNASMGNETGIGKRVIVLGGGNVAFDCARTAKRLGSEEIHVACLEARDKMTADEEEIEQAQEEGIQNQVEVDFNAQYVLITLNGALLFDSGSADIREDAYPLVDKISNILSQYDKNMIDIEGHTDNVPIHNQKYEDNDVLSMYRALTVADYIREKTDLDPGLIKSSGRGDYVPVADNSTPEGRAINRRVEVKIYNSYNSPAQGE